MEQYHKVLKHVMENGIDKGDRTGTGTRSVFGYEMRFDLQKGFPLITTKRVSFKFIVEELLWFLEACKGGITGLQQRGVTIWDDWKFLEDDGKVMAYGCMWRNWQGIDQIDFLVRELFDNPNSRRHILETWNVPEIHNFVLPPCHKMAQFNVTEGRLSCILYLRSNDLFLGNPYNVAQYALLTHIFANICGYELGDLVVMIGDAHIYSNHFEQVNEQLSRQCYDLPTLQINRKLSLADLDLNNFTLKRSDFTIVGYNAHPSIAAPVAV